MNYPHLDCFFPVLKKFLLILLLDLSVTLKFIFIIVQIFVLKIVSFFVEQQSSGIIVSHLFYMVSVLLFTQGQTFLKDFKDETGFYLKAVFSVLKLSTHLRCEVKATKGKLNSSRRKYQKSLSFHKHIA